MINIVGTYECKVDAKARILFPSALKKQLQPVLGDGFVIKRSGFSSMFRNISNARMEFSSSTG